MVLMMRPALFLLPLLLLVACGRNPDEAQVQRDIEERLNGAFPDQVLTLEEFERQGRMETGEGIVVFFRAGLRVDRPLDLGKWGGPNAQLLAGIMGAGTSGIAGLTQGGNQTGDRLTVFGTLPYRNSDGTWMPAAVPGPVETRVAGPPGQLSGAERLLATLGDTLRAAPSNTSPAGARVIEEELQGAVRSVNARLARLAAGYPLASGPPGGSYEQLAKALAADAAVQGVKLAVLPTAGSVENIQLLRQRTAEIAFVQADVAALAAAGEGVFAEAGAYDGLRALLALFPEHLHIVVRGNDRAQKLADLAGRRASLGLAGSGTRVTAAQLLAAAKISVTEPAGVDALDPRAALTALKSDDVDVVFIVGAAPFLPVVEAFGTAPLRLLPVEPALAERLKPGGLMQLNVPALAYPGQKEQVPAIAVAALLTIDSSVTEAEARRIGETVLNRVGTRERDSLALMVAPATAGLGIPVPLHPGAAALPGIRPR
jgi:TRAP transporter TAXI family solute receptor